MFSKTKTCQFILQGLVCPNGEQACKFSHQAISVTVQEGSPVKQACRGNSRQSKAKFQPQDAVEEEKVRSPPINKKINKLFQEMQTFKNVQPEIRQEVNRNIRGGSQLQKKFQRGGFFYGSRGGHQSQQIGLAARISGVIARGVSQEQALRGRVRVSKGEKASNTGNTAGEGENLDKGTEANSQETNQSQSGQGRGGGGEPTGRGRGYTDHIQRGIGRVRGRDQRHQTQVSNNLVKTQESKKVQGILQSFIRIVEQDQNIEEKFYESVLKDGCIQANDNLKLRRIILKFINMLIIKKIEIDRQALLVALNHNFFDLNSLETYRNQVCGKSSNLESYQVIDQIIEDLQQWAQAGQRVLFCYKSRYLQVPAQQLKLFASYFEKDVQAVIKYAITEKEKKLGERFQLLNQEIETLLKHWNNLKEEDPNYLRNYPKLIQEEKKINEEPKPTDDFRKLNINPTIQELLNFNFQPLLRKIHLDKGFDDLEDYLDRNFRLLKEDFTSDLREGLGQYKRNSDQKNLKVNIYPNCRISGFHATKDFFGLRLQIFQEQRRGGFHQSWQIQRKLMLGNMIIFSPDSFQQNIVICVIKNKDGKQMDYTFKNYGFIEIDVEIISDQLDPFQIFKQFTNQRIVILESKCYFEAYFHILGQLQQTQELPFEELIVYTNTQAIFEPPYLQAMNANALVESKMNQFTLDQYQRQAFKNAFTKNVSLIQGPPGTGKTFIGEKIAQLMLEMLQKDKDKDTGLRTGPIFLTCYTNHALDQFLEKISQYTKNIVRLGGGTKNELLKQFTLGEIRKKRGNQNSRDVRQKLYEQYDLVRDCLKLTSYYEQAKFVQTIDNKMIRDFQYQLQNKMKREQLDRLMEIIKDVQQNFYYETQTFIERQTKEFAVYYKKNVTDQIPVAAMFYWLGMLNLDFVLAQFNQMKQDQQQNQFYNEEIQHDEYLKEAEEIDSYIYVDENLIEASKFKALISQLMQRRPLIFQQGQNQCQTYHQLIQIFQNQHHVNHMTEQESLEQIEFIMFEKSHQMSQRNRWILNNTIIQIIEGVLTIGIQKISNQIKENIPIIKRMQDKIDKDVLQTSDIVAMTTTGVAKYKKLINRVDSKIMIVEEAAQILESHMATSLTPKIEHLILIGDHEQLRPSNNVYELSKRYNLDISMFERLINNNFENVMLKNQRRMRPQISEIMRQIYPNLEDDPRVHLYPDIRGINNRNYIFFNHEFPEDQIQNLQTKTNPKEADIIVRFTAYLLQQNYKPEQITVLSLYTGQLLRIKQCVIKSYPQGENPIRQVKIVTVDNYQGEENDIVILSLVRSNHQDNIGFLKASNRVCVALSRARYGMFIFGNAQCLRNAAIKIDKKEKVNDESLRQEHLWLRILEVLNQRGDLLQQLELKCNNHGNVTVIKDAKDFDKVPEGGCNKICEVRMQCGHSCISFCHIYEITETNLTGHDQISCNKACVRPRDCGHECTFQCYECKGKQKPCEVEVKKELECGHVNEYKCSEVSDDNQCLQTCERYLACGHKCKKLCRYDCNELYNSDIKKGYTNPCKVGIMEKLKCGHEHEVDCGLPVDKYKCQSKVEKSLPCSHMMSIPCWQNPEEFLKQNECKVPCNGILECDHPCPNKCSQCHLKNFHGMCNKNCGRPNICNHECKDKCSQKCHPCKKQCPQKCSHSKCTQKCGEVCYQCTEPCDVQCKHSSCSKLCYEICDRQPCYEQCEEQLSCGHPCLGFCGEACPKTCREKECENYDESVFEILFGMEDDGDAKFVLLEDCGHAIEADALGQSFENALSSGSIKYLECPKCKTHIRNCQRYQLCIKGIQHNVDAIKKIILQELEQLTYKCIRKEKIAKLQNSIDTFEKNLDEVITDPIKKNIQILVKLCKTSQNNHLLRQLSAMEIQTLSFKLNCISQFMNQVNFYLEREGPPLKLFEMIELLSDFFEQLQHKRLHEKRLKAIEKILKVFSFCLQIHVAMLVADNKHETTPSDLVKVLSISKQKLFLLSDDEFKVTQNIVDVYKDFIKYDGQSYQEMIIKAVGLQSGHWYTCPKGHVYAIGDCGMAMETSKCPECGSKIGGSNHQVFESNQQVGFGESAQVIDFNEQHVEYQRQFQ